MFMIKKTLLLVTVLLASSAAAQPSFRITSFISHRDLTDRQKSDIQRYAASWAEAMLTNDAAMLTQARKRLSEPLDQRWSMSNTARMHYGESLLSAFEPFLSEENKNQMAAVNALQVLSLLGTERSVTTMMHHASSSFEDRVALRQWASAGLERSFHTGRLPLTRLTSAATLLADAASREPVWHVASRQLQSLASLGSVPGLKRSELAELQKLSFELQVQTISNIVEDIAASKEPSLRMRAVRGGLSELRLALIEPGIDATLKSTTLENLTPVLIRVLEVTEDQTNEILKDGDLTSAYGGAIETVDSMLRRHKNGDGAPEEGVRSAWESGDHQALSTVINFWRQ
ncbi:MAG: hypothetical protein QGI78_02100 [Phycisphaerales bacterium]|jgi:hypothetical protein|nr:hypothetical protein [Phycisphaerales bacterium]